ncbi:MAG: hypothetical protein WBI53_04860 [Paludibacter sp.]
MLIIEPIGGLANRMRVIVSAVNLKKRLNFDLNCVWEENSELNAPFNMLFEKIEGINFIPKLDKYNYLKSTNQKKQGRKKIVMLMNKIIGFDYCLKQSDFLETINIIEILKKNKRVYIRTCEEFFSYNNEDFHIFKPVKHLLDEIQINTMRFNFNTIGLHIRRFDNSMSIEYSPLDMFIEKIDEEIQNNEKVNFFLSTDDTTVEELLIEHYKGRIIVTRNKILNRNSVEGIKNAIVDMYSLSATSMIYGSYWSSFSDIASRIGNVKCITIKK